MLSLFLFFFLLLSFTVLTPLLSQLFRWLPGMSTFHGSSPLVSFVQEVIKEDVEEEEEVMVVVDEEEEEERVRKR